MNTKALSPIIGTVLLISVALIIAGIIFTWAKSSVIDLAPTQHSCPDISFTASLSGSNLGIVNRGNIQIEGFEIKSISGGSIKLLEIITLGVPNGKSASFPIEFNIQDLELLIVPIIEGESANGPKSITCPDEFGVTIKN